MKLTREKILEAFIMLKAADLVAGGLSPDKAMMLAYKDSEGIEKTPEFNEYCVEHGC